MALFKRALWRSGLTYRQTCDLCKTTLQYTDELLDFRPWFADGFVYCPTCQKPLRHKEIYAINGSNTPPPHAGYCIHCGKAFHPGDVFCAGCGKKRS